MLEKESSNSRDNNQGEERERDLAERENTLQRSLTRTHRGRREGQGERHKRDCERKKRG